MRHQYGISVAESQTFLLAKCPSEAMSEEKRLPFAGHTSADTVPFGSITDAHEMPRMLMLLPNLRIYVTGQF